jgi:hypothetical protein
MSAPTFTEALTQAEALARTKYPERAERITQAMALVKEGRVFQSNDGRWEVDSASTLAVQLSRKAMKLMGPQASEAPPPEPTMADGTLLPEAPSSANFRCQVGHFEMQFTLRDAAEGRLLARLEGLLKDQRIRPIPRPAPRAQGQWKQRQYTGR